MQPPFPAMVPPVPMQRPRGAFLAMTILTLVGGLLFGIGYFTALMARSDSAVVLLILAFVGLMLGFCGSLGAAITAPPESGHQRIGFLFLAAAFLYLVTAYRPYSYWP